jgi:hypothetical protein
MKRVKMTKKIIKIRVLFFALFALFPLLLFFKVSFANDNFTLASVGFSNKSINETISNIQINYIDNKSISDKISLSSVNPSSSYRDSSVHRVAGYSLHITNITFDSYNVKTNKTYHYSCYSQSNDSRNYSNLVDVIYGEDELIVMYHFYASKTYSSEQLSCVESLRNRTE